MLAEPFAGVVETHTGVVFFVGDRAYKLKKPVRYDFLDFTTRSARLEACRREVALNRRLAPDVYLGVADVTGPDGELSDHLVIMRRLPAARALSRLASSGASLDQALEELAEMLGGFHARAERSARCDAAASRDATLERWEANARQMAPFVGQVFDPAHHQRVLERARRYLFGREPLFSTRVAAGRACDGHGDLLADDVFCLDDGPRVLDCLEFDDGLRFGDGLGDVASLAMELERLGRVDEAASFLARYQNVSADDWPPSLAHHYIAYRAQVRALVAALRFAQGDPDAAATADALLELGDRHLERGRVRLVVIGGSPGTGKSSLAAEVAPELDAVVLRSDEVRKRRAGLDPTQSAPAPFAEGLYRPEVTEETYRALLEAARIELSLGRSVILDATFSDPKWRVQARELAERGAADLAELHCVAPPAVIEERLATRSSDDPSDATVEVARRLAPLGRPWPEATVLETAGPPAALRSAVRQVLEDG